MIRVDVWVADPASALSAGAFGAGALARIERSATQTGVYAEVSTVALDASTARYTWWDPNGSASSWYRWRASNAGGTVFSPYSDPFQGSSATASVAPLPSRSYASLDQLLGVFETAPAKPARVLRLGQLLVTATNQVIDECDGRDYFAHPGDGSDAVWTEDGDGGPALHAHYGLISLTSLELSFDGGLTYVPVVASDYMLRWDSPWSGEPKPEADPYFHVVFTGFGSYTNFPRTVRSARLTGRRGHASPPIALVEATAQRARQIAFADGDYSGSAAGGPDEFGAPAGTDRFWPQSLYNFIAQERSRFMACYVGGRRPR